MTEQKLREYLEYGHEIEFRYEGKMYSITFSSAGQPEYISFCEFYQEPVDVKTVDELLAAVYKGVRITDMIADLSEDDIWIY